MRLQAESTLLITIEGTDDLFALVNISIKIKIK